jgi:hypothetical protein
LPTSVFTDDLKNSLAAVKDDAINMIHGDSLLGSVTIGNQLAPGEGSRNKIINVL